MAWCTMYFHTKVDKTQMTHGAGGKLILGHGESVLT